MQQPQAEAVRPLSLVRIADPSPTGQGAAAASFQGHGSVVGLAAKGLMLGLRGVRGLFQPEPGCDCGTASRDGAHSARWVCPATAPQPYLRLNGSCPAAGLRNERGNEEKTVPESCEFANSPCL